MGTNTKYYPGMRLGPYDILFISRDYKESNGNWIGTFECPMCGKHFQTRINRIVSGEARSCGCFSKRADNMIGKVNKLNYKIIAPIYKEHSRNAYWKCKCLFCGSEFEITTADFNYGVKHKCPKCFDGVLKIPGSHSGRTPEDLTGQKFGMLTAIEYAGDRKWKCLCECGNISYHRADTLKDGNVISCGCISSKGEWKIGSLLKELNIEYYPQKTFDSCRFPNTNALAKFDFYLEELNILIEYNGIQHYEYREETSGWNTKENFEITQYRDQFKINWCKENNIKLIIIPYTDFDKLDKGYLLNLIS